MMIERILAGLLIFVAFLMGEELSKFRAERSCEARVAQAKINAENWYKGEAKALLARYQSDEAKLIEKFNEAIKGNLEIYNKRLTAQGEAFEKFLYSRQRPRVMLPRGPQVMPAARTNP